MKKFLTSLLVVSIVYIIFKFLTDDTFFWGWIGGSLAIASIEFKDSFIEYYSAEKETEKE
jgi:hypothetical protein